MNVQIAAESRRKSEKTLLAAYPGATLLDVTSKGPAPWVQLSPFYPHGGIPVPFSDETSMSVEGVWQGLKVFENADVDTSKFSIKTMKGIKRSVRKNGPCLGHRKGPNGDELLDYQTARWEIYLPTYKYLLENSAKGIVAQLTAMAAEKPVVLLDYETNSDVLDLRKPLSHAAMVVHHILGTWPSHS